MAFSGASDSQVVRLDDFLGLLLLFKYWSVDLVANELKELSKGLLVSLTDLAASQLEVNLGEVHSDGFWHVSLEKLHKELKREASSLSGSCGSES